MRTGSSSESKTGPALLPRDERWAHRTTLPIESVLVSPPKCSLRRRFAHLTCQQRFVPHRQQPVILSKRFLTLKEGADALKTLLCTRVRNTMAKFESEYDSEEEASKLAPPPHDPFANAGRKSANRMLMHQETRLTSKHRYMNATLGGTWAERYLCALWLNRFEAWRTGILKSEYDHNSSLKKHFADSPSPQSTPTGEHFCRFLVAFIEVHHADLAEQKGVLAYDTMRHGVKKLKKALTQKYEAFRFEDFHKLRAEGMLDQMAEEGLLTRATKRSNEPAGIVVMRRIVMALYRDAGTQGTSDWNTTLSDITGLLLLTALGVRAGDILGDTKDVRPDLPGLRYSDVKLHVKENGQLRAQFRIRSAKGTKRDESQFHYVVIEENMDAKNAFMCPLKAIIVLALRSGNLAEKSFDGVLAQAKNRNGHLIKFQQPDRPVVCAINGAGLCWTELSSKQRANRCLLKALSTMGLAETVTISPHQLRHGLASDLTITKPGPTAHSRSQVSAALAHGNNSRARDTDIRYSHMYSTEDTWSSRLALSTSDDVFSTLVAQTEAPPRGYERRRARPAADDEGPQPKRAFRTPSAERDQAGPEFEEVELDVDDIVCSEEVDEQSAADIELSSAGSVTTDNASDVLLGALTSSREAFVDTFSRVNVVRTTHRGTKGLDYARRCGEDPTNCVEAVKRFMFQCKHNVNGCQYEAVDAVSRDTHEMTCRLNTTDPTQKPSTQPKPTKQYVCTVPGCGKKYNGERERDDHIKNKHTPTKCFLPDCVSKQEFTGEDELRAHFHELHPAKGQQHPTIPDQRDAKFTCAIQECSRVFSICTGRNNFTPLSYLKHLTKDHGIESKTERDALLPHWAGNPCFYPGCTSKKCFPQSKAGREAYNTHLRVDHMVEDEAERYAYSYDRVRGYELPRRPEAGLITKARASGTRERPMVVDSDEE